MKLWYSDRIFVYLNDMQKAQLKVELQKNIERCFLIDEEEKKYWLSRLDKLPVHTLRGSRKP